MTNTKKTTAVLLTAGALLLAACGDEANDAATTTEAPVSTEAPASTEAPTTTAAEDPALGDIVDVAVANGSFTTLAAALEAAGLVETLKGDGPFTVFAPTDDAFAALPEGVLEKLLLPENVEVLRSILTYHVLAGSVPSDQVPAGMVATVQGENIEIVVDAGTVTVNGAKVVAVDVVAANGVIHVIDAVILPPTLDLASL